MRAVSYIIDYIVKYQNTYVSSFLFTRNIPSLIQKGVDVATLFDSDVFYMTFDYDEWPSTHQESEDYMRPYNGSIFDIRKHYRQIFHEERFVVADEDNCNIDSSKIFKVQYSINMLSILGEYVEIKKGKSGFDQKLLINEGISLMDLCTQNDQIDVFESGNFIKLLKFKWASFARSLHMVGFAAHIFYVAVLMMYIYQIYIENNFEYKKVYETMLIFAVLYPAWYDTTQMIKGGIREYFSEIQNYSDLCYIWGSVVNVVL